MGPLIYANCREWAGWSPDLDGAVPRDRGYVLVDRGMDRKKGRMVRLGFAADDCRSSKWGGQARLD